MQIQPTRSTIFTSNKGGSSHFPTKETITTRTTKWNLEPFYTGGTGNSVAALEIVTQSSA